MIFYLVIDTTISAANLKKIRDAATDEFGKTRPGNTLSVAMNPLYNEAYLKIETDEVSPYIKQKVQAAMDLGWVKSVHRDNKTFVNKLREYWATLPDVTNELSR